MWIFLKSPEVFSLPVSPLISADPPIPLSKNPVDLCPLPGAEKYKRMAYREKKNPSFSEP